jgi:hypothetical protein
MDNRRSRRPRPRDRQLEKSDTKMSSSFKNIFKSSTCEPVLSAVLTVLLTTFPHYDSME